MAVAPSVLHPTESQLLRSKLPHRTQPLFGVTLHPPLHSRVMGDPARRDVRRPNERKAALVVLWRPATEIRDDFSDLRFRGRAVSC